MKAIVAVDDKWGIGYKGELLQRIPGDMKNFKKMTIGNVIVMGRETFNSLPGKSPLKDRVNVVLSRRNDFIDDRIIICKSIEEALTELDKYQNEEIFIIGGEMIYNEFLDYCSEVYITKIKGEFTADKYFPNLDINENWELVESGEDQEYKGIQYNFNRYRNMKL